MLPNRFPDYPGDTNLEYNTVDAALWFFEAVRSYLHYGGDAAIVKKHIYPKLNEIVDWHICGTRYGIRLDSDGLLHCGEPGVQLTWMDAKIGDWVVTPRHGKPVEIQALWYNALRIMETLAGRQSKKYLDLAEQAKRSFNEQFWNEKDQCLFDVVDGEHRDASIRPNQIFAVSLQHTMLDLDRARAVVEAVQRELLTSAGLRSLSPRDPQYCGKYEGGVWERDSAYHQGTVWPWLIEPFITAYVKSYGRSKQAREQAAQWLESFYGMMGGWLHNLSTVVWKKLHMLVYVAYTLLIAHVSLGALQSETSPVLAALLIAGAFLLAALHLSAAFKEFRKDQFMEACDFDSIREGRAKVLSIGGERVAVFKHEGKPYALSNVCRHQGGPLGEGKIVDGCVTCPWHGYQYKPDTGTSPPPYNDKIPTFPVAIVDGKVLVNPCSR